jgi:hypothetical protein
MAVEAMAFSLMRDMLCIQIRTMLKAAKRLAGELAYSSSLYPGKLTAGPSLKLNGAL